MKEQILQLRRKGKTYNEIVDILGCSKSLIAYHCSLTYRENALKRNNASRIKRMRRLKEMFGGKCLKCGYNKCLAALDFHHLDPQQKENGIGFMLRTTTFAAAVEEAKKCQLICSNCHRELHDAEDAAVV